jgi:hypothetical protein
MQIRLFVRNSVLHIYNANEGTEEVIDKMSTFALLNNASTSVCVVNDHLKHYYYVNMWELSVSAWTNQHTYIILYINVRKSQQEERYLNTSFVS